MVPDELNNQVCSTGYFVLRPKQGIHNRFVFYALFTEAFMGQMAMLQKGASYPAVTDEEVRAQTIAFPPLPEQQRIVGILDDAFEAIVTAKANAEENLRNARALFESYLQAVLSQPGEEWERVTLEDLLARGWIESHLDGNHGSDYPRKEEFISEGIPYISANCVIDDRVDMSRAKYLSAGRAALLRKGIAKSGDVLFAHNATVGPVAILRTDQEKVILGTSLTYYRCHRERVLPEYLAHYMRSSAFKTQYLAVMRQSTRNQVPITKQREFYHIIPPLSEQRAIVSVLEQLFESSRHLESIYRRKLAALDELKKSLLHRAFAGELTASEPTVIPIAAATGERTQKAERGLTTTDLHAGILALAYRAHERAGKLPYFGHVKAEKIAHMVEARLGIDLGRTPVKDAAGPNDYPHLMKVEHRARNAQFFDFRRDGSRYVVSPLRGFDRLIERTQADLGERYEDVVQLIELMVKMDTEQAEIVATVYAAWNNLLLDGMPATDEDIVRAAREDWHPDKLKIERSRFFKALEWMRDQGLIPTGTGPRVADKPVSAKATRKRS